MSQCVENAFRSAIAKRKTQSEFIRRGITAIDATRRDGNGIPADRVVAQLEAKLAAARPTMAKSGALPKGAMSMKDQTRD
jgi:hypothetical protein